MITTMIFDLDGTLAQTERLKAISYARAAGMQVIAVSTPFTRQRLHESGLLPPELIVDEPERVTAVAAIVQETG